MCSERNQTAGKKKIAGKHNRIFDSITQHLSGGLPDLSVRAADLVSPLLLQDHDLEAVEVGQSTAELAGGDLLSPGRLGPLVGNTGLLPELGDNTSAGTTGQLGNDDGSEGDVSKSDGLAGDTGLRAVNEDALVVNNLDDSGKLASLGTVVDDNNTANFNKSPLRGLNFCRHFCCLGGSFGRVGEGTDS